MFVYPDYRASNPYQTLFYGALRDRVSVRYAPLPAALNFQATQTASRPVLFHLHWEDAVYRHSNSEAEAMMAAERFVANLTAFRQRGGRVIWTVHNQTPHDDLYLETHRFLTTQLSKEADAIHVHSYLAAQHLVEERQIDRTRIIVTPHGNYLGHHSRWDGTQVEARQRLHLPEEGVIFLLFGRLGAYKGVEDALECFRRMDKAAGAVLLVAGKQIEPLAARPASDMDNVVVRPGFIDDEDVALLFCASDFVFLPYRRTFTSGTAVLALSMGRPVIAPAAFHLREIIEHGRSGFLYDQSKPTDRCRLIESCAKIADLDELKSLALLAGESLDWSENTKTMLDTYRDLATTGLAKT